ncbi:MAG: homoserine dehydrogenase [Planctomycetota bacterium]|jgi:homoserine dehydrogenase
MKPDRLIVLKFGGSVLASEEAIPGVVHEIYRNLRRGRKVIAVVSALAGTTDALVRQARRWSDDPDPEGLAALLATGEATSAALLALGLSRAGIRSVILDAERIGLKTRGPQLNAEPADLDAGAVDAVLDRCPVAILPGFVGRDREGGPSLLGRGGSDLTALFAAHALKGSCRLIKDVNGLYERDPSEHPFPANRFASITWRDALALKTEAIQPKAIRFAWKHSLPFEVTSLQAHRSTVVGEGPTRLETAEDGDRPLRVALLGLGTVGLGVYRALRAQPDRFEVTAIVVRNPDKPREKDVVRSLVTADPRRAFRSRCDVVVEAMGGRDPAAQWLTAALDAGIDVVTANKEVMAIHGPALECSAARRGVRILSSACTGGGVPVLETIGELSKRGEIRSVTGVLNGTTNFVLDRMAAGVGFDEAVKEAQEKGFAEPDPTSDLDGSDAAWKLAILARAAFGKRLDPLGIDRTGITGVDPARIRTARAEGGAVRLQAVARRTPMGLEASVRPEVLPGDHPLAGAHGEENVVVIEREGAGRVVLRGKGAGRWPTTESVLGDILELARCRKLQRFMQSAQPV